MTKEKPESAREELRKAVIMGCHPECKNIEEALERELGFGCIIKNRNSKKRYVGISKNAIIDEKHNFNQRKKCKIIGLPITIGRVMQALGELAIVNGSGRVGVSVC